MTHTLAPNYSQLLTNASRTDTDIITHSIHFVRYGAVIIGVVFILLISLLILL